MNEPEVKNDPKPKRDVGLHNFSNLWKQKPKGSDWLTLILLIFALLLTWSYYHDIGAYKNFYDHRYQFCQNLSEIQGFNNYAPTNFSNITIVNFPSTIPTYVNQTHLSNASNSTNLTNTPG